MLESLQSLFQSIFDFGFLLGEEGHLFFGVEEEAAEYFALLVHLVYLSVLLLIINGGSTFLLAMAVADSEVALISLRFLSSRSEKRLRVSRRVSRVGRAFLSLTLQSIYKQEEIIESKQDLIRPTVSWL